MYGTKYNDLDGDGVRDPGEPGVDGVRIFIDTNRNGVLDAGEASTWTDANGNYALRNLPFNPPQPYLPAQVTAPEGIAPNGGAGRDSEQVNLERTTEQRIDAVFDITITVVDRPGSGTVGNPQAGGAARSYGREQVGRRTGGRYPRSHRARASRTSSLLQITAKVSSLSACQLDSWSRSRASRLTVKSALRTTTTDSFTDGTATYSFGLGENFSKEGAFGFLPEDTAVGEKGVVPVVVAPKATTPEGELRVVLSEPERVEGTIVTDTTVYAALVVNGQLNATLTSSRAMTPSTTTMSATWCSTCST